MHSGLEQSIIPDLGSTEPTRYASVLGRNIERLRTQAKIRKKTFALMVGIGRPQLDKIERGEADVRLSVIVKMADALETSPQELLSPQASPDEPAAQPGSGHARLS